MTEKKYIIISGLNIKDNNRGTAALGYGSITFLRQKGLLETDCKLLNLHLYKNFLKPSNRMTSIKTIKIDGVEWQHITIGLFFLEWWLLNKFDSGHGIPAASSHRKASSWCVTVS